MRTRRVAPTVLGLDLSLKRSAACFVPAGWELGEWGDLTFASFPTADPPSGMAPGRQQLERARRVEHVAAMVVDFARRHSASHFFLEDYAFSKKRSSSMALAELRGVVRGALLRSFGQVPVPVSSSAVRSVFFGGSLPQQDAKVLVQQALYAAGATFTNDDECDAYAVASFGMSELGLRTLTFDPPPGALLPRAPRKRRR